jgi:hypothetical protein
VRKNLPKIKSNKTIVWKISAKMKPLVCQKRGQTKGEKETKIGNQNENLFNFKKETVGEKKTKK